MARLKRGLRNYKYAMRNTLGSYPFTYPILSISKTFKPRMVTKGTDICIEGFPRSANSFAYNAFINWNPQIKVAHHLHVPMQIIRSSQLGVPCVVLIRTPIDALSSLLIVDSYLSEELAIRSYLNFYERILPYQDHVIITDFRQVIDEFHNVIAKVNEKYSTSFQYAAMNPEMQSKIFSNLRHHHRTKKLPTNLIPIPDEEKDKQKLIVRERLLRNPTLEQANLLYHALTQSSPRSS